MEKIFLKRKDLDFRANEAYKTLRTNLQFCGDDIKVITFTSCTPNEGKTSISLNLSISFAETGKKIILIDADLRKSVIAGRYKIGRVDKGLSHYLSGQANMDEVVCNTDIDNMDIILSGSNCPNPAELLEHMRFGELISKLRNEYDYVIIDTPPLGSVIDSAIVAKVSDGVVLVVEANAISHRFAGKVKEQLERTGCRILGAVINKVPFDDKNGYYGKYYGRYYGKYYGKYYGLYGN